VVRSYKLRGAYNMMVSLPASNCRKRRLRQRRQSCQGFAYSCRKLAYRVVFMPIITPNQKVHQTKMFGKKTSGSS